VGATTVFCNCDRKYHIASARNPSNRITSRIIQGKRRFACGGVDEGGVEEDGGGVVDEGASGVDGLDGSGVEDDETAGVGVGEAGCSGVGDEAEGVSS